MNKDLLTKLKCKKEMCHGWQQSQVTQEELRCCPSVWGWDWENQSLPGIESGERCGGQQQKLLWVYLQWRKTRDNVSLLLNERGTGKGWGWGPQCHLHLGQIGPGEPQALRPEGKSGARKTCPQWRRIMSGNTQTNWVYTSSWGLREAPVSAEGAVLVSLWGHFSIFQ